MEYHGRRPRPDGRHTSLLGPAVLILAPTWTAAGDLVPGRFFVEVAAHTVLVTFDRNVAGALAGAVVLGGAARDFQGEPNPPRTIRW